MDAVEAYTANFKRILWYVFAATRGGPTRIRIVELLLERPYNVNQLSEQTQMDYKTIQHHIKILIDNKIITTEEKKYGAIYFPSALFEQSLPAFEEIRRKLKKE